MSQKLFDHMHDEHNLVLLDSEMREIVNIVNEDYGYDELKKAVKEMREIQKRYFQLTIKKAPDDVKQSVLVKSKELEKFVDDLISDKLF